MLLCLLLKMSLFFAIASHSRRLSLFAPHASNCTTAFESFCYSFLTFLYFWWWLSNESGTKKRLGFRKKTATSFTVQRSEEVAPDEVRHLVKQVSSASSDGEGSITGDSWVPAMRLQAEGDVSVFVEGLGPGQLVGRQALASVNYGDIQLSICERKGNIEVEVIRARNLMVKQRSRILPGLSCKHSWIIQRVSHLDHCSFTATYVKVHMWKHRKCVAKARTTLARRTLDPLYQQQLIFHEDFREAVLQVKTSLKSLEILKPRLLEWIFFCFWGLKFGGRVSSKFSSLSCREFSRV